MTEKRIATVFLELGLAKPLDYIIPEGMHIEQGSVVEVPLRGSKTRGIVFEIKKTSSFEVPFEKLKPILRQISEGSLLSSKLLELAVWMADYYITPLGKVLKTFLPAAVRKNTQQEVTTSIAKKISLEKMRALCATLQRKAPAQAKILEVMLKVKGKILRSQLLEKADAAYSSLHALVSQGVLEEIENETPHDISLCSDYFQSSAKTLNEEQKKAFISISEAINTNSFSTHLLHGITGSGKTEVYLQAIDKALSQNKGVLMLVPEISLTEQTIERLQSRIAMPLCVLHHRLSAGQKSAYWEKLKRNEVRIALGARSCIFAPVQNLGLIIVDEEHESSYKQNEELPRYHARDVAIMRGKIENATVVLGSATPSIESYMNATNGRYVLHSLTTRPHATLAKVITVDMRREFEKANGVTSFSQMLLDKISERKKKKEQTILFLNRRGFATELSCTQCGASIFCPHCSMKLAFHKNEETLICHLCHYRLPPPTKCPSCSNQALIKYRGVGTERIESTLKKLLPDIRTLRIDADTTRHKGSIDLLLKAFRAGKADVLIGTQMIAKGHHFPEVTLVGVLNADLSLNLPDFRAQEQVFQLITQVAGRSGRGLIPGEVVVQTLIPEHPTIQHAVRQEYVSFFNDEIEIRKSFGFPPFSKIIKFSFVGKDERKTEAFAMHVSKKIQEKLPQMCFLHEVQPSGHAKTKDHFFFHFFIRGPSAAAIRTAFHEIKHFVEKEKSIKLYIDVDPTSLFF